MQSAWIDSDSVQNPRLQNKKNFRNNLARAAGLATLFGAAPAAAIELDATTVAVVEGMDFYRASNAVKFAIDEVTNTINVELDNGIVESFGDGAFAVIGNQLFLDPDAMSLIPTTVTHMAMHPAGFGFAAAALVLSGGTTTVQATSSTAPQPSPVTPPPAPENQTPAFDDGAIDTFSLDENETGRFSLSATDPDGDTLTYSIDDSRFLISDEGRVTVPAFDHESEESIEVTVTATDENGNSVNHQVTVTVDDVNEAPAFTAGASDTEDYTLAYGDAFAPEIYSAAASDEDEGDTLAFAIQSVETDTDLSGLLSFYGVELFDIFEISNDGELAFKDLDETGTNPLYLTPFDASEFTFELSVTDSGGLSDTMNLVVDYTGA